MSPLLWLQQGCVRQRGFKRKKKQETSIVIGYEGIIEEYQLAFRARAFIHFCFRVRITIKLRWQFKSCRSLFSNSTNPTIVL